MSKQNELKHFGIKGMKWGIRRYENEDGTLTPAGKHRYSSKRAKAMTNEMYAQRRKEFTRLQREADKRERQLAQEANAIADKYGLDYDDGGGGDTTKYSEKELLKAGSDYLAKWDEINSLRDGYSQKADKLAADYIVNKYGNTALKDVRRYENAQTDKFFAVALGTPLLLAGILVATSPAR